MIHTIGYTLSESPDLDVRQRDDGVVWGGHCLAYS